MFVVEAGSISCVRDTLPLDVLYVPFLKSASIESELGQAFLSRGR